MYNFEKTLSTLSELRWCGIFQGVSLRCGYRIIYLADCCWATFVGDYELIWFGCETWLPNARARRLLSAGRKVDTVAFLFF